MAIPQYGTEETALTAGADPGPLAQARSAPPLSVPLWSAPHSGSPIRARVQVPGSKSLTNRALILASQSIAPVRLRGVLASRDSDLMIAGLRTLGVDFTAAAPAAAPATGSEYLVTPPSAWSPGRIDCGLAGTVMRFLPPLAARAEGDVTFDGDPQARRRPQGTLLGALRTLGVSIAGDTLPFTLHGTGAVPGGAVTVDASASSQFISGLLLSAAAFRDGLELSHVGPPVPNQPHIRMTVNMLRAAGVQVAVETDGAGNPHRWTVAPGAVALGDWRVEPDLSNSTPFFAAALATGGRVEVTGIPQDTLQPVGRAAEIFAAFGASLEHRGDTLVAAGTGELLGVDLDLANEGELTPTVAALAALAESPSRLRGIGYLRGHETDRLAALATELTRIGAQVTEEPDGLSITPGPLRPAVWHTYHDHRLATAGAIVGLRVPGLQVENVDTTAKTFPGFAQVWADTVAAAGDRP